MNGKIEKIIRILTKGGAESYGGEAVSQLQHALQCANLAENAHESNVTIAACLLHDIGHLLHHLGEDATDQGIDDTHEDQGAAFLNDIFGPEVTEPIRLHVKAKRYLCCVNKDYWNTLSPVSKKTLVLQGGIFSEEQAAAFIAQPYADVAVKLRVWDDEAKVKGLVTPELQHYQAILEVCTI